MRLFLWDQMERFDLVPACQIPSRSTVSPIHMHTASKQPGTMQNTPKVGGRGVREREREREREAEHERERAREREREAEHERERAREREVEGICVCMCSYACV